MWRPNAVRLSMNASATTSAATTGTTHGTPWIVMIAVARWRSWLSSQTATSTTSARPPTLAPQTDIASVGSPALRRDRIASSDAAAKPPITSSANSQPSATGMFLFITLRTASSRIGIVPPSPIISSIAPCNPRKNASVTTKLGIPSRATSTAIASPIRMPVISAARSDSGQAQPRSVSVVARIAAPMPAAKPADRSISPSSSTKTSPIASTVIAAPWLIRLAKLPFDRNVSPSRIPKITTSTTTPMIAGSDPMSPPLTRVQ